MLFEESNGRAARVAASRQAPSSSSILPDASFITSAIGWISGSLPFLRGREECRKQQQPPEIGFSNNNNNHIDLYNSSRLLPATFEMNGGQPPDHAFLKHSTSISTMDSKSGQEGLWGGGKEELMNLKATYVIKRAQSAMMDSYPKEDQRSVTSGGFLMGRVKNNSFVTTGSRFFTAQAQEAPHSSLYYNDQDRYSQAASLTRDLSNWDEESQSDR